ncbi:Putative extracellular membrane protein, CFEM [Septoria linicola]|uniref:Extracellular membrane protein, CFEM n=1 Tax=Septoria linicola TaxID=215465 RepID=A0A9Q9B1X1_9PEZI|nr:putative extracellular membrane protein, CFEM [Septoria linicola]USW59469.1 Putative extracellular membrane protein, CFEM [Septoria linicola]
MRLFVRLLAVAVFISSVHADVRLSQRNEVNVTAQQELPICSIDCARRVSEQTGIICQPADPCYCNSNTPRSTALRQCLRTTCTLDEQLISQRFQASACQYLVNDRQAKIREVIYPLSGLAVLFTAARLLSRWPRLNGAGYWWDDFVVVLCVIPVVVFPVDSEMNLHYGLGRDMWSLDADQLTNFLLWFYIAEPLYITATRLTKLSLVLLYMRLWPEKSALRYTCMTVAILLILSIPAGFLPVLLQCMPVSYYWKHLELGTTGTCINQTILSIANAVIVIAFDVVVLLLPVRNLLNARVPWSTRLGVLSVFLVGFAVIACSGVRVSYISLYSKTSMNITFDYRGLAMWSHIEVYLSLVCCSMPQMPGLVRRVWTLLTTRPRTRFESDSSGAERASTKLWGDKYAPQVDTSRG